MGEIKKQSISNTFLSYIGAALGFFTTIYLQPNLMSSGDIGLLRLMYSFSWMAAVVMPLGFTTVTLRFFPKIKNEPNRHNGLFSLLLIICSIGGFLVAGLLFYFKSSIVTYYSKSSEFASYFNEALIFAFFLSLISTYSSYSSALLRTTYTVFLTDVFVRVGHLVVVLLYYYSLITKEFLVVSYISIFILQLILLLGYLVKIKAVTFKINFAFFKTLPLKNIGLFAFLMMLTAMASLGIKFIDQLAIGALLSENSVGVYATSVMLCAIMEIPFNSLERIAQPKISEAWAINDTKEVSKIYEMSSRYMFFIGALMFCLLWAGLDFIFSFLPPEYANGKIAFYIASFASLLNLVTGVNSSVILMSHKYFATTVLLLVLIIVSCFCNYFFIPLYDIAGAALALLVSIGVFNVLKYIYIIIRLKMQPFSKHTFAILLVWAINLLVIIFFPLQINSFFKAITCSLLVILSFSILNVKLNTVPEINKLFKRFKFIN